MENDLRKEKRFENDLKTSLLHVYKKKGHFQVERLRHRISMIEKVAIQLILRVTKQLKTSFSNSSTHHQSMDILQTRSDKETKYK